MTARRAAARGGGEHRRSCGWGCAMRGGQTQTGTVVASGNVRRGLRSVVRFILFTAVYTRPMSTEQREPNSRAGHTYTGISL